MGQCLFPSTTNYATGTSTSLRACSMQSSNGLCPIATTSIDYAVLAARTAKRVPGLFGDFEDRDYPDPRVTAMVMARYSGAIHCAKEWADC